MLPVSCKTEVQERRLLGFIQAQIVENVSNIAELIVITTHTVTFLRQNREPMHGKCVTLEGMQVTTFEFVLLVP